MGITEDNPYGFQNRFSEVTGLDAKNLSYSNIMSPQQRQGIMQLTLDRYLDPMSQGQLRPGMRSGDITQYGIVQSVPKAEADMNMAEKLLSNNMLGNMLGIGQELRLGDLPAGSPSMIPASASVAGEDPRYTSSGAYKVETPEFLQNTMDSIASGIGSLRERFSPDPNLSVDIGAAGLQGASPAEAILVSDLSIGDLLKRGIDSTTDFLNIPNSDNFNPNNPSITPYLESPDLNGSGGNTMGVNFKFPFYG